jgi:hypothetical protein
MGDERSGSTVTHPPWPAHSYLSAEQPGGTKLIELGMPSAGMFDVRYHSVELLAHCADMSC